VYFHEDNVAGKVEEGLVSPDKPPKSNRVILQCFPLYSILLAVGKTKVDYFSLDVEGSETQILKTVPWHRVDIKVNQYFFLFNSDGSLLPIRFHVDSHSGSDFEKHVRR
jgi:hypothetical protein